MQKSGQQLKTPQDIRRLGTILSVGAHPDDETFCAGALLATAVRNGQRVICVTATKGEQGVQDPDRWPADQLATIRTRELQAALKELGVTEHHWLNYRDGDCDEVREDEAAQHIASLIEHCSVDSVVTFGPDGLTGHPDHQAVSRWVDAAVHSASRSPRVFHVVQSRDAYEHMKAADEALNIFFNTDEPPFADEHDCVICLTPDDECIGQKYRAFAAMPSQMEKMLSFFPPDVFAKAFGTELFVEATGERR